MDVETIKAIGEHIVTPLVLLGILWLILRD